MSNSTYSGGHLYQTVDGTPNAKVVAETIVATLAPMLLLWLADVQAYLDVEAGESIGLGLIVGVLSGITGYMKRPGPTDGIRPDPTT